MIRRPPRSTLSSSSAASDVYKRQVMVRAKMRKPQMVSSANSPNLTGAPLPQPFSGTASILPICSRSVPRRSACYPSRLLRFGLWARPQLGSCGQPLSFQSSIEELNLVPSILLDPIHCRVCTLDQSLAISTVVWKDADPYAGGDMKNVRLEVMRGRECRENLVRDWQQTS